MGCQDTPLDTPLRALRQGDAADSASSGVVFVLINGLFDGGISGAVRTHLRERFPACRFLSLHCGAVSSVRDRAVECFWQLKGGIVDYQVDGVELEAGHGRFGEQYVGLLPAWSDSHPIHILAYSLGAPTAVRRVQGSPLASSSAAIHTLRQMVQLQQHTCMHTYSQQLVDFAQKALAFFFSICIKLLPVPGPLSVTV